MPNVSLAFATGLFSKSDENCAYSGRERPGSFLCGPLLWRWSVCDSSADALAASGLTHQKSRAGLVLAEIAAYMTACMPQKELGHAPATTKSGCSCSPLEMSHTGRTQLDAMSPSRPMSHAYSLTRFLLVSRARARASSGLPSFDAPSPRPPSVACSPEGEGATPRPLLSPRGRAAVATAAVAVALCPLLSPRGMDATAATLAASSQTAPSAAVAVAVVAALSSW
mmetsp:Transcript_14886/g.44551  ORF Transcript_14886/g.44551 Transcript_14886/m.44551 type:complete len:225 (-) Transcript_14886:523-1197(-)